MASTTHEHHISPPNLSFAVILLPGFQWLDAAGPVDYLNDHSQARLRGRGADPALVAKAPILTWYYVASTLDPIPASSGPKQPPTHTFATCPRVDYVLMPGNSPSTPVPPEFTEFVQTRFADPKVRFLTVCTGSILLARTGILNHLRVASNKKALKHLAQSGQLDHNVHWVGDRRWVKDGKVWSAAGITSGIDLAAEFARVYFDKDVVEEEKEVAEEVPKPDTPDPYAWILKGIDLGYGDQHPHTK
ncbi:uncharacterized protein LACBIDRAFT_236989 [Laccaria bicolor S238N-H82]|uniref:Predicted protein n=1 Tax=Laccaria bicolor (strain S238N-H82 / ATCC MYA-4686) TaxID=486041 RepID=B0DIP0_LACBS|nr:uncharacterized protein LACBIDRAFT_236989 [Laccaria bicolor S238N-H82]EDR05719.1 predicted protein [Laccaria bicolor S238N-H82]|eukprot:XP_001883823.1 predicted protein [Laccaria bicolor S238N-H82]